MVLSALSCSAFRSRVSAAVPSIPGGGGVSAAATAWWPLPLAAAAAADFFLAMAAC
uniref:Uncharacterized protein n=1 Tax=Arundo donax TaxID=35708 RepID=A0A0A8YED8_ARUDO